MNKITRHHVPAASLPADLREGLPDGALVTVVIEPETTEAPVAPTLEEIFARARPAFATREEADRHIRDLREEWD